MVKNSTPIPGGKYGQQDISVCRGKSFLADSALSVAAGRQCCLFGRLVLEGSDYFRRFGFIGAATMHRTFSFLFFADNLSNGNLGAHLFL